MIAKGSPRARAAVLATVLAGIATVLLHPGDDGVPRGSPADAVRIVDAAGRPLRHSDPAAAPVAPPLRPAPPVGPMLAEAPAPIRRLHDEVARTGGAGREDEGRLRQAFAAVPDLPVGELTVTCSQTRCEVHGVADGDESAARLAIRDGAFLDRVAALGYTSGMDMVSARGARSEIVVFLDRTG